MSKFLSGFKALVCASAALLCGGAWAATPIAVWTGDFTQSNEGFTIDLNGNAASEGAVTIANDKAIKISLTGTANPFGTNHTDGRDGQTKVQVLIRYSDLDTPAKTGTEADSGAVMVSYTSGTSDYLGNCVIQGGVSRGIWTNSGVYGIGDSGNDGVLANGEGKHTYVSSYTRYNTAVPGMTSKTFEGTLAFVDGSLAYRNTGLKAGYAVEKIYIGGKIGNKTNLRAANGMKIYGIALFNTLEDPADTAAYDFATIGSNTSWADADYANKHLILDVTSDCELTLGKATTLKSLQVIGSGTVKITDAQNLTVSSIIGSNVVLQYTGTVATPNDTTKTFLTSANWSGTVILKNVTVGNVAAANRHLYLENFGGVNSKVVLDGVSGWWLTTGTNPVKEFELVGSGLTIKDGSSGSYTVFKKVTGSGSLVCSGGSTQGYVIQDGSEFRGSVNASTKAVSFGTVNRNGDSPRTNKIFVDGEVTIDTTWTASAGIVVDGTLHLTQNGVIPTASGSGTIVCDGKIPNNSGLAAATWTGTLFVNNNFPSCGSTQIGNANSTVEVAANKTLTLTELTSIDATLVLREGAQVVFTKTGVETFTVNASAAEDIRAFVSQITIPDGSKLVCTIKPTQAEYANGLVTRTDVPESIDVKVALPGDEGVVAMERDGTTLTWRGEVKISGAATSIDVVFDNYNETGVTHDGYTSYNIDYTNIADIYLRYDKNPPVYTNVTKDEDGTITGTTENTGVFLNNRPYIYNLQDSWFESTTQLSLAVVGFMPTGTRRMFIHMGDVRSNNRYGLVIATGDKDDEVIVGYNKGATFNELATMSVPNATSTRHSYVVTKNDIVGESTTFTIFLDGIKWKTVAIPHMTITGGFQVGSAFGGSVTGINNNLHTDAVDTFRGCLCVMRAYNRVISDAEIAKYAEVYPYTSPNGASARTFADGAANWSETSGTPWSNTAKGESSAVAANEALDGSAVTATLTGAAEITINVPEAGKTYEALTINGTTGSVTFKKGDGAGSVRLTGMLTVGRPMTVEPGSLDLSGGPVTILSDGLLTFDYSEYDLSDTYVTTTIKLTGDIERDDEKVLILEPASHPYYTFTKNFNTTTHQYELVITPNHQNGDRVYFNAASTYFDGKLAGKVELEDGTKTVLFPNDIVVLAEGKTLPAWVGKPVCAGIAVETDVTLGMGAKSDVDQSLITAALDGKTVTIAQNKTLTLNNADRNWAFGSVTMNGSGSVLVKGAVTATAIAGNATLKLANNATLTVGTELTVGRVVSNESNMVIVKESINSQTVYSLAYASTAEDIVIETIPEAGVTIQPGAVVTVTLSGEATPEDLAAIAEKVAVKYTLPGTETVKDLKAEGLVTVSVNQETGAVELTTTNDAIPAATDIEMAAPTEEGKDKIQFTITSPIPGLFYAVSSCDTPDGTFESATGDQATSSEAKTVSIPMTFGENQKVKYYRVNVKATK